MNSAAGNASSRHSAVAARAMTNERHRMVEIQGIEEALVALRGPRQFDAAKDAARQKTVGQHDGERRGEQHGHREPRGQQEPGAQLHEKVISSAALQVN